ncbi:uncharacterized protein LOC119361172 [Triticum dicoccoides]|uniref:uncharacterized protein LOC119361172 n=1 Tax=Triticum dicoccoides TaxID=85692 RepID=UPI00188F3BFC|nr:uncharacterized protein LOC119361172 [Triticum dicoccoides]
MEYEQVFAPEKRSMALAKWKPPEAHTLKFNLDAFGAEVNALSAAITTATELGATRVVFETDSQLLADAMNVRIADPSQYAAIIEDLKLQLKMWFAKCSVIPCRRTAKSIAYELAQIGRMCLPSVCMEWNSISEAHREIKNVARGPPPKTLPRREFFATYRCFSRLIRPLGSLDKANPQPQISRTHLVPPDLIASDLPAPADHRCTTPRAHLSAPPPTHPQRSSASPPSDRRLYHSLRLSLLRPFRSDMCSFTSSPSCAVYRLLRPSAQPPLHQPVGGLLAIALSISSSVPRQLSARCHLLQTDLAWSICSQGLCSA